MTSRSKPRSKRLAGFGLALVASLAIGALASANASALTMQGEGAGGFISFTHQGGATFSSDHGPIQCTASSGSAEITKGTSSGLMTLFFTGCKEMSSPFHFWCTTPGISEKGWIKTPLLKFELVYLNAAKTQFGWKLSPNSGEKFAESFCYYQGTHLWTGSLLGEIESPALNVASTKGHVTYGAGQIEGSGPVIQLSETLTEGSNNTPVPLTANVGGDLFFNQLTKFVP